MLAAALAAIAAFEVILFREHDVSLFGVVVVFSFYFFAYCHGHTTIICQTGSRRVQNRVRWSSCNSACAWAADHRRRCAPGVNHNDHRLPQCVSCHGFYRAYTSLHPDEYFRRNSAIHNRCEIWSRSETTDSRRPHSNRFQ